MALYAIGDIHGCNRSFQALLQKLDLQKGDELVLVGDYLDRGPDSKGVLDTIFALRQAGHTVHCLRGNHEQIFIDALTDTHYTIDRFYGAGGRSTLKSFGAKRPSEIDDYYLDFINNLPNYLEVGHFLFVHGGLNFDHPDPLQDQESMLWERYWYNNINYVWLGDRYVVHGHTPITLREHEGLLKLAKNGTERAINLDTGCVFHHRKGMGLLTAVNLTTFRGVYQPNIDQ